VLGLGMNWFMYEYIHTYISHTDIHTHIHIHMKSVRDRGAWFRNELVELVVLLN
jgi:hypothetical protein